MPNLQQRRTHASIVLVMALAVLIVGAIQIQSSEGKGLRGLVPMSTTTSTTAPASTTTTPASTTTVPVTTTVPPTTVPPPPPAPVVPSAKGTGIWQWPYAAAGAAPPTVARARPAG